MIVPDAPVGGLLRPHRRPVARVLAALLAASLLAALTAVPARAEDEHATPQHRAGSITDTRVALPSPAEIARVLTLRDYNTALVVLSTATLGLAAGLVGTFLLLRKQSLMGDALSHATLPGIAMAFIVMVLAGGTGKDLPGLLAGAMVFGLLGVGCVLVIRHQSVLGDDAALGVVLSVFFGGGVALLGVIQKMPTGSQAGLESFIYGKTASVVASDLQIILAVTVVAALASAALYKEFTLLCFDEAYASSLGLAVRPLDVALLALVTTVTVVGLQAVGLILVIALLIIPPAAARFWTERLFRMLVGAAIIGALCGWFGASLSALVPRLPAGAVIVIVAAAVFLFSMIFGTARGVIVRLWRHWTLVRKVARQHLLRTLFEMIEPRAADPAGMTGHAIPLDRLLAARSWSPGRLRLLVAGARREGLVTRDGDAVRLTDRGASEATRVTRNHRLWEIYLITHADVATSHVDRDADRIEHVLGPGLVAELEAELASGRADTGVPPSPHLIETERLPAPAGGDAA